MFLYDSSLYNRCFECNEELSTHCNKKALAQCLDFLQKHSLKATSGKEGVSHPQVKPLTDFEKSFYEVPTSLLNKTESDCVRCSFIQALI